MRDGPRRDTRRRRRQDLAEPREVRGGVPVVVPRRSDALRRSFLLGEAPRARKRRRAILARPLVRPGERFVHAPQVDHVHPLEVLREVFLEGLQGNWARVVHQVILLNRPRAQGRGQLLVVRGLHQQALDFRADLVLRHLLPVCPHLDRGRAHLRDGAQRRRERGLERAVVEAVEDAELRRLPRLLDDGGPVVGRALEVAGEVARAQRREDGRLRGIAGLPARFRALDGDGVVEPAVVDVVEQLLLQHHPQHLGTRCAHGLRHLDLAGREGRHPARRQHRRLLVSRSREP
mmetsp:Transcript_5396/g.15083  ORF Transcript_5396/g.15083 Transcript_5396/m.15083 type:complete len:290 (-) Transcript_5396:1504-2373(-)